MHNVQFVTLKFLFKADGFEAKKRFHLFSFYSICEPQFDKTFKLKKQNGPPC